MAGIHREPNGRRTVQFMAGDGKRKSIRLGKVSQRIAEDVRIKVESLNAAILSNLPVDGETAQWVARLGDGLANKLAAAGLIAPRSAARLSDFLASYIAGRTDVKPRTRINLGAAKDRLVEFFGAALDL